MPHFHVSSNARAGFVARVKICQNSERYSKTCFDIRGVLSPERLQRYNISDFGEYTENYLRWYARRLVERSLGLQLSIIKTGSPDLITSFVDQQLEVQSKDTITRATRTDKLRIFDAVRLVRSRIH
jgi:hypothetical protein